jgi:uncharacterized caspase-like protein
MNENDYAIVVGIDKYPKLRNLDGATNDAFEFKKWLLSTDGGNIKPENCFYVVTPKMEEFDPEDPLPEQKQIDIAILKIFEQVKKRQKDVGEKGKRIYFYFSGHGIGEDPNKTALLMAAWHRERKGAAISLEDFLNVFRKSGKFEEIVFITDCCRSKEIGAFGQRSTVASADDDEEAGEAHRMLIYSTQYQDESFEVQNFDTNEFYGICTKILIEGLSGKAANRDGIIDADSLRDYLYVEVPRIANEKKLPIQKPMVDSDFGGDHKLIFKSVSPKITYTFNIRKPHLIDILDGDANLIQTFNGTESLSYSIKLNSGLYEWINQTTNESNFFRIRPNENGQQFEIG